MYEMPLINIRGITQNWKKIQKPWTEPCTKQRQNEDGKKCHLSKFDFITQQTLEE